MSPRGPGRATALSLQRGGDVAMAGFGLLWR